MLNDLQKDALQILLNHEIALSAVKDIFIKTADGAKPNLTETDNDKLIGQKYRAYEMAREIIEQGFKNLLSFKKINEQNEEILNKAR